MTESDMNKSGEPSNPSAHEPSKSESPVAGALNALVSELNALANSLPLIVGVAHVVEVEAGKRLDAFLEAYGEPEAPPDGGRPQRFKIPADHVLALRPLDRRLTEAQVARRIIPRTFLNALVSQWDAFLGRLIRGLLDMRPELLCASEKSLSFAQLSEFSSFVEAKEYLVEKEIESVLRDSHTAHFAWLEKKCDLQLRKDLPVWPRFIELTERRNLFVHSGGKVSSQYLKICREQGVNFALAPYSDQPKLGDELDVNIKYFRSAYRVLCELGVKLTHVIWRKLRPEDREAADDHLSDVAYDVLVSKDYVLAQALLDFAADGLKKHSSENARLRFVVNRAQAYKWAGDDQRALKILDSEDWTAIADDFRLCVVVLRNQFIEACSIMRRVGTTGKIGKTNYRDWPIFRKFRESPEFLATFSDIFGEPFAQLVTADRDAGAQAVVAGSSLLARVPQGPKIAAQRDNSSGEESSASSGPPTPHSPTAAPTPAAAASPASTRS